MIEVVGRHGQSGRYPVVVGIMTICLTLLTSYLLGDFHAAVFQPIIYCEIKLYKFPPLPEIAPIVHAWWSNGAHLDLAESLAEGPALEEVGVDARGEDEGAGAEVVGRHAREQQPRLAAQTADPAPGRAS